MTNRIESNSGLTDYDLQIIVAKMLASNNTTFEADGLSITRTEIDPAGVIREDY